MVPDLLLILALGVHDDFGKHLSQDVFEQLGGELETGPDVTLFQDIQHVAWNVSFASTEEQDATFTKRELTIELVFSIEVSIVKYLHRNLLLVMVFSFELGVIGGDEFLNINGGDGDLFVLPFAIDAHDGPISNSKGNSEDGDEEDVCFEPSIRHDRQDTFQYPGDTEDDGGQMEVAKVPVSLSNANEGWIFYGRSLGYFYGRIDHGCRARGLRKDSWRQNLK